MDHMNLFLPFENKDPRHEDVLTRNFLFIIKAVPAVREMVVTLILSRTKRLDKDAFAQLPNAFKIKDVFTQVDSDNKIFNRVGDSVVLSTLISDDAFESKHQIENSERHARYDGVLVCEPNLWIVMENKPCVGNVWEGQLDPNLKGIAKKENLIIKPCCLSWRDIISHLNGLLERKGLSETEKILLDDFLMYIDETYVWLKPFDRLDLCKDIVSLIDKRCRRIMEEIWHQQAQYHKGWKWYIPSSNPMIKELALSSDSVNGELVIRLYMHFGVVQSAARKLYVNINENSLKELRNDPKISVVGAFHYGVRSECIPNAPWLCADVDKYVKYWQTQADQDLMRQIKRNSFMSYHQRLINSAVVSTSSMTVFQNEIMGKQYQKLNVCPELQICYTWSKGEAMSLDKKGRLVNAVVEKALSIMSVFNADNDIGIGVVGASK